MGLFTDTIVALSSGTPPSGVAVIRVSGPKAGAVAEALGGPLPAPRRTSLRRLRDGAGAMIDRGLVIVFDGPGTATGEDIAEFHVHGGRAVVAAVLDAATRLPDVRLAEAGEFTRRAFEHGRLDLTGAEGLADLIAAETEGQRRLALAVADGGLRRRYEAWSERLTRARALLEASFDFSDEGDVGEDPAREIPGRIATLSAEIADHLDGARRGEILTDGYRVVIVGPPNAGKSSLLNALAEREVAIVTDVPGTTRDVIEVTLDLGGVPVRFSDTAGLRETEDRVEAIGVDRAKAAMAGADLVLALIDPAIGAGWRAAASDLVSHMKHPLVPIPDDRVEAGAEPPAPPAAPPVLTVRTKLDLGEPGGLLPWRREEADGAPFDHRLSVKTGEGLGALVDDIAERAKAAAGDPGEAVPIRARQRQLLADTARILRQTVEEPDAPAEIQAERLRRAQDRLGALTGRIGVEDLLDVIFSEFCIGK